MATNVTQFRVANRVSNGEIVKVIEQADFFIYTLAVTNLAPGGTNNATVNIQADADFIVTKMTGMADVAGAGQTFNTLVIPLVRVQLTDTGSGRNLFDVATDMSAIAGSAYLPYILPVERRFSANSTIQATFTSYDAAQTYANVRLYLHGYKAWPMGVKK